MACNEKTLLLLSRFANGEATANEATRAAAHAESCVNCRELIDEWQGQRNLLVWASTLDLPELSPDKLREIAQREEPMSVQQRPSRRIAWPHIRVNWAWSAATMATVITLGLVYMYALNNALFTPRLHDGTTLGSAAPMVRVRNGVVLELGPNTRVARLGDDKVRLDAGWLRATVRHGTGLRIQTSRLDVRDVGTVFQMNAGRSTDSVTVEEGEVSVSSGGRSYPMRRQQILYASDKGNPSVHSFPAYTLAEDGEGQPLYTEKDAFYPQSEDSLDWREGERRLAAAFPGARSAGTGNQELVWPEGEAAIRFHAALAQGTRRGIRAHFAEIARAQSGAANIGAWGFPVAYMMLDDVAFPQRLSAGIQEVQMVADGSRLLWRFTDSDGRVIDTPLTFERRPEFRSGSSGSSSASSGNFEHYMIQTGHGTAMAYIRFEDWPGDLKPILRIGLKPLAGYGAESRALKAELVRRSAGVQNLKLERASSYLMYLDWKRSHHLMVVWNDDAGRQVSAVLDAVARGQGGAAVMGVVTTDEPLLNPSIPGGTYLLSWVLPAPGRTPHWQVAPLGGGSAVALPTPSRLESTEQEGKGGGGFGSSLWPNEPRQINLELGCSPVENGTFTFRFVLTDQNRRPPKWGEGWLRVKQP